MCTEMNKVFKVLNAIKSINRQFKHKQNAFSCNNGLSATAFAFAIIVDGDGEQPR